MGDTYDIICMIYYYVSGQAVGNFSCSPAHAAMRNSAGAALRLLSHKKIHFRLRGVITMSNNLKIDIAAARRRRAFLEDAGMAWHDFGSR